MLGTPTFVRNDHYLPPVNNYFFGSHHPKATGSREHYFHFLLGYLLPLVFKQEKMRFPYFQVLNCGPLMTPILCETLQRLGYRFTVVNPSFVINPVYLEPWDEHWDNEEGFRNTVNVTCNAWREFACDCSAENCQSNESAQNLILRRSSPPTYYLDGSAEISGYGTSRRDITNYSEVMEVLRSHGIPFMLYEPGAHSLGCQISTFKNARKIFGIRGAEWANAVWAKPDLCACYVDPNPPAKLLMRLFARLGVDYIALHADENFARVNPLDIVRFFSSK